MNAIPPVLFEALNCLLWTTGFFLEIIFIWYFALNFRQIAANPWALLNPTRAWNVFAALRMRDQAVIGMTVMTFGEIVTRWWTWYARYTADAGGETHWAYHLPWVAVPIVGAAIEVVGRCCLIRVFAPDDWGNKAWMICVAISVGVTVATGLH